MVSLLSHVLGHRGYYLYNSRNVASRIKGGHAAAMLRGSTVPRRCIGDHLDLLIAFDADAIEIEGPRLAADGVVIYDSSVGPVPDNVLPEHATIYEIPFGRLAVRDLRRDLFKNSLAFAVAARLLSLSDTESIETLRTRFSNLPDRLVTANLDALTAGFSYAEESGLFEGRGTWELDRADQADRSDHMVLSGNEAVAIGFVVAGGRFYTGYPITPATDILDWMSQHLHKVGGVSVQAEDELSAVNMAIGAAMTGARTMTGTSSPGFALMQEGLSQLGAAEIPMVIVDCQRSGPSTGMPTKPEQSDLNMVVYGGNGDFPRIVLAPGDPADAFEISVAATNLAQRLQGPVIIVLDQAVGQDATTVKAFDLDGVDVEPGNRLSPEELKDRGEYRRYLLTGDGVSPWAVPGTPNGMTLVTGNEHNEWGQVSADPANRVRMIDKRARKLAALADSLPQARTWGPGAASIGLIGTGMETGVLTEAAERLKKRGIDVDVMQPRTLWPVLAETVEFVASRDLVLVVEHNAQGQLARLLASAGAPLDRIRSVLRYDGVPFTPGEIVAEVAGVAASVVTS